MIIEIRLILWRFTSNPPESTLRDGGVDSWKPSWKPSSLVSLVPLVHLIPLISTGSNSGRSCNSVVAAGCGVSSWGHASGRSHGLTYWWRLAHELLLLLLLLLLTCSSRSAAAPFPKNYHSEHTEDKSQNCPQDYDPRTLFTTAAATKAFTARWLAARRARRARRARWSRWARTWRGSQRGFLSLRSRRLRSFSFTWAWSRRFCRLRRPSRWRLLALTFASSSTLLSLGFPVFSLSSSSPLNPCCFLVTCLSSSRSPSSSASSSGLSTFKLAALLLRIFGGLLNTGSLPIDVSARPARILGAFTVFITTAARTGLGVWATEFAHQLKY